MNSLVRGFNTEWGGGYYGLQWDSFPIRVYGIVESNQQTEEVRTAGKRLTLERFAEFMAAFPDFADHPERDFTIFVAPRDPDERLDK